jgi:hypothetical protein
MSSYLPKDIYDWNTQDVLNWLKNKNMSHYIQNFEINKITGYDLCFFTNEDLKSELKISNIHDRLSISKEIKKMLLESLKLTIIYDEKKFQISLDFDLNFQLLQLIPYISVLTTKSEKIIIYDKNMEILSPNMKIVDLIMINPIKYKTLTVSSSNLIFTPPQISQNPQNDTKTHKMEKSEDHTNTKAYSVKYHPLETTDSDLKFYNEIKSQPEKNKIYRDYYNIEDYVEKDKKYFDKEEFLNKYDNCEGLLINKGGAPYTTRHNKEYISKDMHIENDVIDRKVQQKHKKYTSDYNKDFIHPETSKRHYKEVPMTKSMSMHHINIEKSTEKANYKNMVSNKERVYEEQPKIKKSREQERPKYQEVDDSGIEYANRKVYRNYNENY